MKAGVLVLSEAMARRINACIKACDLIPTATLERYYGNCGGIDAALDEASLKDRLSVIAAQRDELLEALQSVHQWMDKQADAQSKGGHATFDLWALREQRDISSAAITKATGGAA